MSGVFDDSVTVGGTVTEGESVDGANVGVGSVGEVECTIIYNKQ